MCYRWVKTARRSGGQGIVQEEHIYRGSMQNLKKNGWRNIGWSKLTSFRNVYCRVRVRRSCCTYCRALSRCRRARRCRRWGWRCRPLRATTGGSGNSPAFPRRIPTWRYQLARCGLVRARRSFPRRTFSGANFGSSRWRWCPACNSRPCAAACCELLRMYRYDKYRPKSV